MSTVKGGLTFNVENFSGSDCTGSDGAKNRTVDLANTPSEQVVFLNGLQLKETSQYTISGDTVTFLVDVWDDMNISVINHV